MLSWVRNRHWELGRTPPPFHSHPHPADLAPVTGHPETAGFKTQPREWVSCYSNSLPVYRTSMNGVCMYMCVWSVYVWMKCGGLRHPTTKHLNLCLYQDLAFHLVLEMKAKARSWKTMACWTNTPLHPSLSLPIKLYWLPDVHSHLHSA